MSKEPELDAGVRMGAGEAALPSAEALAGGRAAETGLLESCRQGDPQAFARLVALHEAMVFNLALRMLGDPEDARELAQDVFLQVYRTLDRFEGRSSLRTWIYRIVLNQCCNRHRWWRRRRRDRAVALEQLTPADELRLAGSRPESPYHQARRAERARRVQEALLGLSFEHRAVLLLREVEGCSCEEIGRVVGVPEGTVKSRLARAREALRQRLLPLLDGDLEAL